MKLEGTKWEGLESKEQSIYVSKYLEEKDTLKQNFKEKL